jgi:hypothetical protein
MRSALLLLLVTISAETASAQGPPVPYQRTRPGAANWHARGGLNGYGHPPRGYGHGGYGGLYDPYLYAPPIIAGSYYERPYPHHFDYYRYRWGGQQQGAPTPQVEMMPVADCPCLSAEPAAAATPPPVEVIQ